MASRLCPYCQVVSEMTAVWGYVHVDAVSTARIRSGDPHSVRTTTQTRGHVAAKCGNCGALNVAIVEGQDLKISDGSKEQAAQALENTSWTKTWYPISVSEHSFPEVPEHVARCAIEAYRCADIDAPMAAILMARTTIEATAKFKGITRGQLIKKIDDMAAAELIRPALKRAAHAVRILGNDMAHGDVEEQPTPDDVNDTLKLMTMILSEVFEAEAMTDAILGRRKKQESVEADAAPGEAPADQG